MATTEVRRSNRGLWIALGVIAILAILAIVLLSANNTTETADLDTTAPATVVADAGDGASTAAADAAAAARDAANDASAAAASAGDAATDAAANAADRVDEGVSFNVNEDGASVSGRVDTE